jgi:hypothetical protein
MFSTAIHVGYQTLRCRYWYRVDSDQHLYNRDLTFVRVPFIQEILEQLIFVLGKFINKHFRQVLQNYSAKIPVN